MSGPLPLEICKRIVEHLHPMYDHPTLTVLAHLSRSLHPIAEQHLYHSLYLLGTHALPAVLRAITSRPVRASYPCQVYVRPSERERTPQSYWTQLGEFLQRGGAHLELLCIVANDMDAAYVSWVLRSLRSARGRLAVLQVPFCWDTEVAAFLESPGARRLTRLEIGDVSGVPLDAQQVPSALTLRRDAAANLAVVEAPPAALCLLVPGRPVTHVRFRLGPATSLQTLPPVLYLLGECLGRSTAPTGVIALDLGDLTHMHCAETYSLEVIELAPRFLPNLQFFGAINFPWTKDIPVTRLYRPLIRLSDLHTLEFVVSHIHPAIDAYWQLATASELRTFSPSLRQLVFWQGYDRHRWIWLDEEADFVLAAPQESYPPWGGV